MDKKQIPNLHESLMQALDFFIKETPPKLNLKVREQILVIASGNAYHTGKIIFSQIPHILANESNLLDKLRGYQLLIKQKYIKRAIIISASGEKDAIWEIKASKKYGLKTTILTCNPNSKGAKIADEVISYKKIKEPQTYNISTYLGMILAATDEKAIKIKKFIETIKLPKNFADYQAYAFIIPDKHEATAAMFDIKKHELFGPFLSIRSFSEGDARHAKFVNLWDKELVISFGKNFFFGDPKHRWQIKLPTKYDSGLIMALGYYLIGKIQNNKEPYFKKNIEKYCQNGPKAYGQKKPFPLIVE